MANLEKTVLFRVNFSGPRLFSHGNQCLRGIQVTRMRLFDQNVEIRAIFVRQDLKWPK